MSSFHTIAERPDKKTRETYKVLQKLKKSRIVCVPTYKTNSTRVIKIKDYKFWVSEHLLKADDLSLCPKFIALLEDANKLLEKVKMEFSVQEENIVRQSLATRAIRSPKLLIKYHKKINYKEEFLTRLVIPATNFTATLSNIDDLGIKIMLYKVKLNYSFFYIVKAYDLKEILEEMKVKRDKVTIASFDSSNMYP